MICSNNDSDMGEHLVQFINPIHDGIPGAPTVLPDKIQALKKFVEEYFEAANKKHVGEQKEYIFPLGCKWEVKQVFARRDS